MLKKGDTKEKATKIGKGAYGMAHGMPRFFKAGWRGWSLAKRAKECASKMGE